MGDSLYEDAAERAKAVAKERREKEEKIQEDSKTSFTLQESQEYLEQKFASLYEDACKAVTANAEFIKDKSVLCILCLSDILVKLLERLGFLQDSAQEEPFVNEIWDMLTTGKNESIAKKSLHILLLSVIGIYRTTKKESEPRAALPKAVSKTYKRTSVAEQLSIGEAKRIHIFFKPLYYNFAKATHERNRSQADSSFRSNFSPSIDELSAVLVARSRVQTPQEVRVMYNT